MNARQALALIFLTSTVLATGNANAALSWDAQKDFSAANPSNDWSYGYDPASIQGYQFTLFDLFSGDNNLPRWSDSDYDTLGTPSILKNLTGSETSFKVAPGQLSLHPGQIANGDAAILRFTAPITSQYTISGQFFQGDSSDTVAWVVKNSDLISPLMTIGSTDGNPTFLLSRLDLVSGDTLDFVVGNNGSFYNDSTPLAVQINAVPPVPVPGAVWFFGSALLGFVGLTRKKLVM